MGSAASVQHLPRADAAGDFDCLIAEPSPAGAPGARRASRPSAPGVASVPREPRFARYSPDGVPDRLHGASRQDMRKAISDILHGFAFNSAARYGSGAKFICIGIDERSPCGVHAARRCDMPGIPEDRILAWCARETICSEEDCCRESTTILNLLIPREAAFGLESTHRRSNCGGTSLTFCTSRVLPRRQPVGFRRKRITPIGLVVDDRLQGEHRQGSMDNRNERPSDP